MGFNPSAGPLKFERETAQSVVVNGNQRPGMVVLETAATKAIQKAKSTGMAICGTYNTCTSTGMLAYYADKIAKVPRACVHAPLGRDRHALPPLRARCVGEGGCECTSWTPT